MAFVPTAPDTDPQNALRWSLQMDDPFDLPPDVLRRVPLFAELAKVLSWSGGPVNWDLARQVAVSSAAGEDARQRVDDADARAFTDHVRVAEMWLAETTGISVPGALVPVRAIMAVDWAEQAATSFAELIDPVAAKASGAIGEQLAGLAGDESDPIRQALGRLGPMMMGIQAGTVLGQLAREVLGTHEIALPVDEEAVTLIAPAIDRFATEHGIDRQSVRQWVALQAAARRMTLEGNPWVRAHFFALYHNFVATLDVTLADGIQKLQQMDLSDPSKLQEAIGEGGLFSTESSPQTAQAAARIARFLSVIEAHATVAVETTGARLGAEALTLAEAFSRRAAEAGAGMRALEGFIGLEADADRPRALAFVRAVLAYGDWPLLGRIWEDAESFPSETELADPQTWIERMMPS